VSTDAIGKVVSDYFAATRAMDMEAWVATFDDNATSYDPVGGPPLEGLDSLRQFFQGITGAFEKVGLTEDKVFISGNGAAVMWTGRGVGKNGREVSFEGIDVFEINEEGRIQRLWAYWDPAALMAKLQS
jgi:steroid delta-isomerase